MVKVCLEGSIPARSYCIECFVVVSLCNCYLLYVFCFCYILINCCMFFNLFFFFSLSFLVCMFCFPFCVFWVFVLFVYCFFPYIYIYIYIYIHRCLFLICVHFYRPLPTGWNQTAVYFSGITTHYGFVFCSPLAGLESPRLRGFMITHNDAPQSVGFLWTSDQSVAETATWQHTTLTTDKHPCPRWEPNCS